MARKSKGKVGIIGLGIMGGAFARNLIADGWEVIGIDTDPARRKAMAKAGVTICDHVKELLPRVPMVITSLPSPKALHAVVSEIAAANAKPHIVVEASTFALDDKLAAEKVLRKAGHTMLDCPVSGTGAQAAVKDLVIYASGDTKAIKKTLPVFAGFSRQTHDLGAFGNGSKMKYVANLLVAIHNVAAAEAMVLGMKAGLEPEQIFKFATGGAGNSRMLEIRGPMMVKDDYDRSHDEELCLAKGHDGDRRICSEARRADADVQRDAAGLRLRHVYRLCRAGYRGGLRRAGENGGRKAAKEEAVTHYA